MGADKHREAGRADANAGRPMDTDTALGDAAFAAYRAGYEEELDRRGFGPQAAVSPFGARSSTEELSPL